MPVIVTELDQTIRVHPDAPELFMRRRYKDYLRAHRDQPDAGSGSAQQAVDRQADNGDEPE